MSPLSDFGMWLAAGQGRPPSEELAAAAHGLDHPVRRRGRRAVRRGEAAGAPAEARYAVALARESQRRSGSRWGFLLFLVLALLTVGIAVGDMAGGNFQVGDALLLLFAAYLAWVAWVLPRRRRAAVRAETINRELLEQSGEPYVPLGSEEPVATSPLAAVAGYAALFLSYAAFFGAATTVFDGQVLTVANVWHRGWLYATLMTIANATFLRRRGSSESRASLTSR